MHNKPRWRVWHVVALTVLAVTAMGGGCVALIFSLTRPVVTAGDTFMTALKDGDFETAYAMGTPALREELGSPQRLEELFGARRPVSWSWWNRQIQNQTGSVAGRVTYTGGGESEVVLFLLAVAGDWKVSGFRMNPQ
jgi:hypothetical protein